MVAGGAFYWINEANIVICSDDATVFDPHVSYGITAALEPAGWRARPPRRGAQDRTARARRTMSATRAREIGLVSEVVPADALPAARPNRRIIAAKLPAAIQGTVKAVWDPST